MTTKEEALGAIDRLEELWLESEAAHALLERLEHISPATAKQFFADYVKNPAHKHLVRQRFYPLRAQVEQTLAVREVINILKSALEPLKEPD